MRGAGPDAQGTWAMRDALRGSYNQEKMYFTATEESKREMRVGVSEELLLLLRQRSWQEVGRLEHRKGEPTMEVTDAWLRGSIRIRDSSLTFGFQAWVGGAESTWLRRGQGRMEGYQDLGDRGYSGHM